MVTTEQIKNLREMTGVSVMECKKALEEALGNEEKALLFLRKKSKETAAKKSDRDLGAGKVTAYIHSNGSVGVLLELLCETDFVSGNEEFSELARNIAMHIAAMNPKSITKDGIPESDVDKMKEVLEDESKSEIEGKPEDIQEKILEGKLNAYFKESVLLEQAFVKDPNKTIRELIETYIQKFGERIEVARFERFSVLG